MSVIIDTEVFEHVRGLLRHVAKSVTDIRQSIDEYLSTAEAELKLQREEIADLERKAQAAMEEAEKDMHRAEQELNNAKTATQLAYKAMQTAEQEKNSAWALYKSDLAAAKQGHYFDENIAGEREDAEQKTAYYNEMRSVYYEAQRRERNAQKVYDAKRRYYERCVAIYNTRVANREKADSIVLKFRKYKDNYYHSPTLISNWGVDLHLKFLANSMVGLALHSVDQIETSVENILSISMKLDNSSVEIQINPTYNTYKDESTRIRIMEKIEETQRQQKKQLGRDVDEKPDPFVRCSECGYPIHLCTCFQKKPHAE